MKYSTKYSKNKTIGFPFLFTENHFCIGTYYACVGSRKKVIFSGPTTKALQKKIFSNIFLDQESQFFWAKYCNKPAKKLRFYQPTIHNLTGS